MDDATGAYVLAPGAAELRWMGETSTYFLATGEQTGEGFALVDERAMRGESVPLHVHGDDVESFYVLEGEITFSLGDGPGARVGAGAFVHVPGGSGSRLPDRVGDRSLPDPHDAAPRPVLPRDLAARPSGRRAPARDGHRIADRGGVPGVRHRARRAAPGHALSPRPGQSGRRRR